MICWRKLQKATGRGEGRGDKDARLCRRTGALIFIPKAVVFNRMGDMDQLDTQSLMSTH